MVKKVKNQALKEAVSRIGPQETVAQLLGTTQGTISSYLSGRLETPIEIVMGICLVTATMGYKIRYYPEDLAPNKDWSWLYEFIELYNKGR